jgi:hypothetical protein
MPDFGFVGQAYEAPDPRQDTQVCVNWYPEISQDKKSKTVTALLGCPGKTTLLTLGVGPVRGGATLVGNAQALVVSGNQVYLLSVSSPATAVTKAIIAATLVGTITSNFGPVFVKDNGVGGTAFIMDGTQNGYIYSIAGGTLSPVNDPGFYGANRAAFIDGWLIFNKPGTPIFYTTPPPPYTVLPFQASYFDLNDGTADNLISLIEDKRELLLLNEQASQWWYDAGGQYFPFARLDGATIQVGCAAANTVALFQDGVIWLARSSRGQNIVVKTTGFNYADVSTIAVNHAIGGYSLVSDALGWTYQEDGHEFYVLTFPSITNRYGGTGITWVYDGTTQMWHQRASYDPVAGVFNRDRANCYFQFQNYRLVGDYQNGNLYSLDRTVYTDGGGGPLVAWRRCPHVWDEDDYDRIFHQSLQFDFSPGLATSVGQGSNPQVLLSWSDDGGMSYGPTRNVPIGLIGQTRNRAITYRLGESRDRVYDARYSDPTNRDITGAALVAGP